MNIFSRTHFAALLLAGLIPTLVGCSDAHESNPGDVRGFNYTDYYIARFRVINEGQELAAGGPNIFPKEQGEERSGGNKSMCCIGIPAHWRPGMKLVVNWNVDKIQDGKTPGKWYTATTEVPPYGRHTYGFVVHFLPKDRIRVQIVDESGVLEKIDDHDPYVVQGKIAPDLNLMSKGV